MDIKQKLIELGAPEDKISEIINAVEAIISQRIFQELYETSTPLMKATLNSLSDDAVHKYIDLHKDQFKLSKEDSDRIRAQVWDEYFEYMDEANEA